VIEIVTLVQRPDLIPLTALWGWREWGQPAGRTLEHSIERREHLVAENGFEQAYVLLDGGVPAAMASLVRSDLDERPDLTPWLAGVYVDPPFRGLGHAARVVRRVEQQSLAQGEAVLWLYTATAPGLYRKLGWRDREAITLPRESILLMRRDLSA
jgi:GNAT superfamily N-acetyltransferase